MFSFFRRKNTQFFSSVGMRILSNDYHDNHYKTRINDINPQRQAMHTPYCLDCKFYIPMEHSSIFPNSGCDLFKPLKSCTYTRTDSKLCGPEGKYFSRKPAIFYPY